MSIAALNQVYDETRRLAVAGGSLASGDFRLKKLVEPLRASAAKAPVFGKVAEAVEKVVDGPAKETAAALLELSTLVTAILYTQGETGAEGQIEPIPTTDLGMPSSNTSARVLKPLIEALTTTGSGREEMIKDAHARGAFKDLRLVRVALGAIDDVYGPIADFMANEVLPMYGKAIYDDLAKEYDPKGKSGAVRRLKLMHQLDPEKTRAHVQAALDDGLSDVRVAAIDCLKGSEEALPLLLELAKVKGAGLTYPRGPTVRSAALRAMATLTDPEVVDLLCTTLSGKDFALAVEPASRNRSPKVLACVLAEAEKHLADLLATPKKEAGAKTSEFLTFLGCFATRNDDQTVALLTKCFEHRDAIAKIKGETDGEKVNRRVSSLLVRSRNKLALQRIVELHKDLPAELLSFAWVSAALTRKPKQVYDLFAPYYLEKGDEKKKKKADALTKRDAIRHAVKLFADRNAPGHYYYHDIDEMWLFRKAATDMGVESELDPRWLDAAMKMDDLELVLMLARPRHKAMLTYLSELAGKYHHRPDGDNRMNGEIYETMIRIEHPKVVEHFLTALDQPATKKGNEQYSYWLARLIPNLPKSAAPQIEALLPTLGDNAIEQIAPYLAELQAKN